MLVFIRDNNPYRMSFYTFVLYFYPVGIEKNVKQVVDFVPVYCLNYLNPFPQ